MSDLREPLLDPQAEETEPCLTAVCIDSQLEKSDRTIVWIETQKNNSSERSKDQWSKIIQQSLIFVGSIILGSTLGIILISSQKPLPTIFGATNAVQEHKPCCSETGVFTEKYFSPYITSIKSKDDFFSLLEANDNTFVNFIAPWCTYSQNLHPIWEETGEKVARTGMPVKIVNVDCEALSCFCKELEVFAYPTMRWYEKSVAIVDYRSERSSTALIEFARHEISISGARSGKDLSLPETPLSTKVEAYSYSVYELKDIAEIIEIIQRE